MQQISFQYKPSVEWDRGQKFFLYIDGKKIKDFEVIEIIDTVNGYALWGVKSYHPEPNTISYIDFDLELVKYELIQKYFSLCT